MMVLHSMSPTRKVGGKCSKNTIKTTTKNAEDSFAFMTLVTKKCVFDSVDKSIARMKNCYVMKRCTSFPNSSITHRLKN